MSSCEHPDFHSEDEVEVRFTELFSDASQAEAQQHVDSLVQKRRDQFFPRRSREQRGHGNRQDVRAKGGVVSSGGNMKDLPDVTGIPENSIVRKSRELNRNGREEKNS